VKKKKAITYPMAQLFVGLLVGGLIVFFVTGKDIFLSLGFVACVVVVLLWQLLLSGRIVMSHLREKQYLDVATIGALRAGIGLLLIYFLWFSLSEMLGVQILGSVPPVKSSKMAISGAVLVGLSVVVLFLTAAFRRTKQ
jgi:hypothetical protein